MKSMHRIVEIINEEAQRKMDQDFLEIFNFVKNNPILSSKSLAPSDVTYTYNREAFESPDMVDLFHPHSKYVKGLKEHFIDLYITAQSESFVKKVNHIYDQMDEALEKEARL
jgi:hypothetical protein